MFTSLTSRPRQMRAFTDSQSVDGLKRWLLTGLKDGSFAPLEFGDEDSLSEHLRTLFATASGTGQEKLKEAITLALEEWTCQGHGPRILIELAYLVGDTRASTALRRLQLIVETNQLRSDSPTDDDEATAVVFSVLGGFSERPEIELFLERHFFDDARLDYRALLFAALCERSPERYDYYLPRLIDALEARPEAFAPMVIFRNFVSIVSFYIIARRLPALQERYRARLLELVAPIFREMEAQRELDDTTCRIMREHLLITDANPDTIAGEITQDEGFLVYSIPYQGTTADNISYLVERLAHDCRDQHDLGVFVLGAAAAA